MFVYNGVISEQTELCSFMARPSKISDEQLAKIWERHLAGETLSALAKEYGMSKSSLSARLEGKKEGLKGLAQELVDVETKISALPVPQQKAVRNFADDLKDISYHLAGSAKYGAMNSHRLNQIANLQLDKIDETDPMKTPQHVQAVAALTDVANEASKTPINLIKAVKDNSAVTPPPDPGAENADLMRQISEKLPN